MTRKKISGDVAAIVMFEAGRLCCICKRPGHQIHHIDGNPGNNEFDNLVYLCIDDHNDASVSGNIVRKLSPEYIRLERDELYRLHKAKREHAFAQFAIPIFQLTTEDLLQSSLTALILIEIEKVREEYSESDRDYELLSKLYKFSNYSNGRVAYAVLSFLFELSGATRHGMITGEAMIVQSLTEDFFPTTYEKEKEAENIELGKQCINIAFGIAYDALIWLKNLSVAAWGMLIYKRVFKYAKHIENEELANDVVRSFNELISTLHRPERDDLRSSIQLVTIFKNDLDRRRMDFPDMPRELFDHIHAQAELRRSK